MQNSRNTNDPVSYGKEIRKKTAIRMIRNEQTQPVSLIPQSSIVARIHQMFQTLDLVLRGDLALYLVGTISPFSQGIGSETDLKVLTASAMRRH